jgi:hypothetical protein
MLQTTRIAIDPIGQRYDFIILPSPGDGRFGRTRRRTPKRHIAALTHHHIGAGRIVENVGWNCQNNQHQRQVIENNVPTSTHRQRPGSPFAISSDQCLSGTCTTHGPIPECL